MKKAFWIVFLLIPLLLVASNTERVLWKVFYAASYPNAFEEKLPLPIYVNNRLVKDYTVDHEYFEGEVNFWVKDGDIVEFRIENPYVAQEHYEIRDHKGRLMACTNPSSPYLGESPDPIKVRLKHGNLPEPAAVVIPVNGDTAYPLSGVLKWSPADNLAQNNKRNKGRKLVQGYRVYWSKVGQKMELISEQNASNCQVEIANMKPDTEYQWKVVPFNEYGEAKDCPVWRYRTALFSFVAKFEHWGGVADFDGDGEPDFLRIRSHYNDILDDYEYILGYYQGFSGNFLEITELKDRFDYAVWHDVNKDGLLDIVCFEDYYDEDMIDATVLLNLDGTFSQEPDKIKISIKAFNNSLKEKVFAAQPQQYVFDDESNTFWVAMDADGDGVKDYLHTYTPGSYNDGVNSEPEVKQVPFPTDYVHYRFGGEYRNEDVLLNKAHGDTVPVGFVASDDILERRSTIGSIGWSWCDFDMDGDADLCFSEEVTNYSWGYTDIYRNENGELVPMGQALNRYNALDPNLENHYQAHKYYNEIYWYDIDGDGDMDLILCSSYYGPGSYYLFLNHTIRPNSLSSVEKQER